MSAEGDAKAEAALVDVTAIDDKVAAPEGEKSVGQDAPKTEKKDIRKHPKYSFMYEVHKYNALYHIVERLGSQKSAKKSTIKRIRSAYLEIRRKAPVVARFTAEILPKLGKRRVAAFLLGDLLMKTMIPITRSNARYDLGAVVIEAIRTGNMDWSAVVRTVVRDLGGFVLEQSLEQTITDNRAKLGYRYSSYLRERIMRARLGLDSVTLANEKVIAHFKTANALLAKPWDQSFLLTQASGLVNDVTNIMWTVSVILRITSTHKSALATWSFVVKLAFVLRRYMGNILTGTKTVTAITDENYRRSEIMVDASTRADAQDQVLSLQEYYFQEYQKAQEAVGDASPSEPNMWDDDVLHPWKSLAYKTVEKMNGTFLYLLLAVNAIKTPSSALIDASTVINDLNALQTATWGFSYGILKVFRHSQALFDTLSPIEKYYTLSDLKPLLRRNAVPITYRPAPGTVRQPVFQGPPGETHKASSAVIEPEFMISDSHSTATSPSLRSSGMTIEFQSVSFTYPNKYKKALSNISFTIGAGQLCSIVGFSGSGKSTLIALLVRLHDPDEGRILINGIDIKRYDPDDLYRNISFLFQKTDKPRFTIREFIQLGRLDATEEEVQQAIKDSGADEIIKKFKHGIDTELEDRHYSDNAVTVDMLVKRAQQWDEGEMYKRGQARLGDGSEDDDDDDPRTDIDTLYNLDSVRSASLSDEDIIGLNKWTAVGAKEELPDAHEDEDVVLAEGYDAKKAEEEEKKNQADTANFSGGEWSKIVLARSFLRNSADLVILDEFSAALDPLSEASIFEKFMKSRGERTIIAVTHRFHLAYRSDLILFLQDGELKEKGRHHELMKMDGKYKEMYLKTTNVSGNEVACQTVAPGEEHIPVPIVPEEKAEAATAIKTSAEEATPV